MYEPDLETMCHYLFRMSRYKETERQRGNTSKEMHDQMFKDELYKAGQDRLYREKENAERMLREHPEYSNTTYTKKLEG
jgi:hypothetical protein